MGAYFTHVEQCAVLFWELIAKVQEFDKHGKQVIVTEV